MSIIFDQKDYVNPISSEMGLESMPHYVKQFFGKKQKPNLLFFLVDGLGFNLMEKLKLRVTSLNKILKHSEVIKMQAPFPTTTVANMTMMHTDLRPAQTGMFEWRYFEPLAQKTILPIRYVLSESNNVSLLKNLIPNPKTIFPGTNLYKDLANAGVKSYVLMSHKDTDSDYTRYICEGANIVKHKDLSDLYQNIEQIKDVPGQKYIFVYINNLDDSAHKNGLNTDRINQTAEEIFENINTVLEEVDFENTDVILSADHGLVNIDPDKVIYINKLVPEIESYFKTSSYGEILLPAGSSRDCFLYVKEDKIDEAKKLLEEKLGDNAQVVKVDELLEMGVFGKPVTMKLRDRIGNLLILPKSGEAIWWQDAEKKYRENKYANHGGMSADEIFVPLLKIAKY